MLRHNLFCATRIEYSCRFKLSRNFSMIIDPSCITQNHLIIAIRWLEKISAPNLWDLSCEEVARLLGVDEEAYVDVLHRVKCGTDVALSNESIERLSLLLGIWKMLKVWAPASKQDIGVAAFKHSSYYFNCGGVSIRKYLLESKTVDDLYRVRYLLAVDANADS